MSSVLWEVVDGVARLTLNRPEAANVLDLAGGRAMLEAIAAIEADDRVGAVLLSGNGQRFCGGGDLASIAGADDQAGHLRELADVADRAVQRLGDLGKPVVAAVHGAVAGVGLALMLSCDLVVAARSTKFVAGYSAAGLTTDGGVAHLLPRAVGQQRALDFLLTSRLLTADEALEWGLVSRVVPDSETLTRAESLARELAAGPTWALGTTRRAVRRGWDQSRAEVGAAETEAIAEAILTPQAQQRIRTFLRR